MEDLPHPIAPVNVDYAGLVQRFVDELRRQTQGKLDPAALNQAIMQGLNRGQEHILGSVFAQGADLDLASQELSPEQLPGCALF